MITGTRASLRPGDQHLLQYGHAFGAHLHAQIAARHHHAVGHAQNFVEVLDGFRLFQLGNDRRFPSGLRDRGLGRQHVGRGAHEAHADVIDAAFQCESQVHQVFLGQRGDAQFHAGKIDALVLAQFAAVHHMANDALPGGGKHAQLDQAVRQQDSIALVHFGRQPLVGGGDAFAIPRRIGDGDGELGVRSQGHVAPTLEWAGAYLWSLQVGEDADGLLLFPGGGAEKRDGAGMLLMRAVGKIQARDVHSRAH